MRNARQMSFKRRERVGGDDESVEDVRPCHGVKKLVETVPHMDPRPEHEVCHAPQWG